MKTLILYCCLAIVSLFGAKLFAQTNTEAESSMANSIANDERIQFFRTAGILDAAKNTWRIPLHGWVYEPQQSRFRKALFSLALRLKYGFQVGEEAKSYYERRLNLLIADNERNKEVLVRIAGQQFIMPLSTANGHFAMTVSIANGAIEQHRDDDFLPYAANTKDGRIFTGQVQLLAPQGMSVISDIDDTIKISEVLDHQRLIENTFLKEFHPVAGMTEVYQNLADMGLAFHYVSSSPWQLYAPLEEFVDNAGFPWATFSLKAIRFRDLTLFDLFKSGLETKPRQIESILEQYPQRQFILIGDSGEQDPEVFSAMLAKYPDRIAHVFIRNITAENIDNERFSVLVNSAKDWTLVEDPVKIQFAR